MPARTWKQYRYMQAIAHGWRPSRKKGPSRAVAKEMVSHGKPGRRHSKLSRGH